jgi:hypothetical protein
MALQVLAISRRDQPAACAVSVLAVQAAQVFYPVRLFCPFWVGKPVQVLFDQPLSFFGLLYGRAGCQICAA